MKSCTLCGISKHRYEFYREARNSDGLSGRCKDCTRRAAREWQRANPEKALRRQREWRANNIQRHRDSNNRFTQRHRERILAKQRERRRREPLKAAARAFVNNAIYNGTLVKPSQCSHCGRSNRRIEAHHHDYSKPFEVDWLCTKCHKAVHAKPVAA